MGGTMSRTFRLLFLTLTLFVVAPRAAKAAPLSMSLLALNSEITFGGATFEHNGYDVFDLALNGIVVAAGSLTGTEFTANGGSLAATTPGVDGTWYEYTGGVLDIDLRFTFHGSLYTGTFLAPIVNLKVFAAEPLDPANGSNVVVYYDLGPGEFDDALANAFGMPSHTLSASADGDFILLEGDSSSPELVAHDGGISFDFRPAAVPEPSLSGLAGLGLLAAIGSRRMRRRS
jgi:hypothetical protein